MLPGVMPPVGIQRTPAEAYGALIALSNGRPKAVAGKNLSVVMPKSSAACQSRDAALCVVGAAALLRAERAHASRNLLLISPQSPSVWRRRAVRECPCRDTTSPPAARAKTHVESTTRGRSQLKICSLSASPWG